MCCDWQVETREDEEQSVKLAEILELLLAAGYFRARIKGLSPFDKVWWTLPTRTNQITVFFAHHYFNDLQSLLVL